jgi:hypothetical protein
MAETARSLGTTSAKLAQMTHVEQMDYVEKYFRGVAKYTKPSNTWNLYDVYLAIFSPAFIKYKDTDVCYSSPQKAYTSNRGHDVNKDGKITKGEISANILHFYNEGQKYKA